MDLLRRDFFRVMMFYDCAKGLHQKKSFENFKQHFVSNAPPRTQVFFWFGEVRQGRQSFDDEHRCGTLVTALRLQTLWQRKH